MHAPFRYPVSIASVAGGDIAAGSGICTGRTLALDELPERIDTILVSGGTAF